MRRILPILLILAFAIPAEAGPFRFVGKGTVKAGKGVVKVLKKILPPY